jgi:hypothetical protein
MGIPEFQSFGTVVGQNISGVLAGKMSVDQALTDRQAAVSRAVREAGLAKWSGFCIRGLTRGGASRPSRVDDKKPMSTAAQQPLAAPVSDAISYCETARLFLFPPGVR